MGTRCNIKITYGDNTIWLYRHWDGYLSETGVDVYNKLQNTTIDNHSFGDETKTRVNVVNFINSFLLDNRYELTNQKHGDIEFLYHFKFDDVQACYELSLWQHPEGSSFEDDLQETIFKPWAEGQTSFYNLFEFTFYEVVEKEVEASEERTKQLIKEGRLPDYKKTMFKKKVEGVA